QRDTIRIASVRSRLEGYIGYLRVTQFSGQTGEGLEREILAVNEEAEVSGVVDVLVAEHGVRCSALQRTRNG
ncbi:MAG: peptidase S41, partial [Pseudomonadota bacterium]